MGLSAYVTAKYQIGLGSHVRPCIQMLFFQPTRAVAGQRSLPESRFASEKFNQEL